MAKETQYKKLTREELQQIAGEELSERAASSLINANITAPVNAAVAANILFGDSVAYTNAEQDVDIDQSAGSSGDEPGDKIQQAEPEEKAEKETTEDIDRAFD